MTDAFAHLGPMIPQLSLPIVKTSKPHDPDIYTIAALGQLKQKNGEANAFSVRCGKVPKTEDKDVTE